MGMDINQVTDVTEGFTFDLVPNLSAIFDPAVKLSFNENTNYDRELDYHAVSEIHEEDTEAVAILNSAETRTEKEQEAKGGAMWKTTSIVQFLKKAERSRARQLHTSTPTSKSPSGSKWRQRQEAQAEETEKKRYSKNRKRTKIKRMR